MFGRVLHVGILAAIDVTVIGLDVADFVVLEDLETALHLGDAPGQRARSLVGLGHHGNVEVRQTGVVRELDTLGVHHDKADLLGRGAHENGHDNTVEQHRLTRARGSRNQKVRKSGNVYHHGVALGIAAKSCLERTSLDVGKDVSQVDRLRCLVGNLDAHK